MSDSDLRSGNVEFDDIPSVILALTNNLLKFVGVIAMVMIIVGAIMHAMSGLTDNKTKGKEITKFAVIGALVSW